MDADAAKAIRLACGPLNQASQGRAWADAANEYLGVNAFSFAQDGTVARVIRRSRLDDRSHRPVPHFRLSLESWRKWSILQTLRGVTHLLNESNSPIFGDARRSSFVAEEECFRSRGIESAIVFHGSDIRDPALAMELDRYSYFHDAPRDWTRNLSDQVSRNLRQAEESGLPTFVSTPDLEVHLPSARLIPLTIDVGYWAMPAPFHDRGVPRVLHRPSRSIPPIKGTQFIMPVLQSLHDEGAIELVDSEEVPHSLMKSLLSRVDVVVDQIQTGSYGVAAVEAMAAGRLVVGNVSTFSRSRVGSEVPIVDANPKTFEEVMRTLLADVDGMRSTAAKGLSFVQQHHDGRAAAMALASFLG